MTNTFIVTRTIKLSKEIDADSKEEAKELFKELQDDANSQSNTKAKIID